MGKIPISQAGAAVTDHRAAAQLQKTALLSFRQAQNVLVATKKFAKGGTWISSKRTCLQKMQQEVYLLGRQLKQEGWGNPNQNKQALVFSFLCEFAQAFPNWQREYEALNRMIPMFYDEL